METPRSVCWRRIDHPGHEVGVVGRGPHGGWLLTGTVVMGFDGLPCTLRYAVSCDEQWRTLTAFVAGGCGGRQHELLLRAAEGRWFVGDEEQPSVEGCVDVDLSFSPVTNLLPIRRLQLATGEEATVRAAWLRFPQLTMEPLEQRYRRTGEREYEYESAGGAFRAVLTVDDFGLVEQYGDIWTAEARYQP